MKFRKKPVLIEAHQWFKNGDHPEDYKDDIIDGLISSHWTKEHQRENNWEGQVVRYYRVPNGGDGRYLSTQCKHCSNIMHDHGWIDTLEGGHIVCPGDWVITGVHGERYPCKPDIFEKTYEKVIDNE